MPLIVLGLLVIVGIIIYALVMYGNSEETDTRPVRERYSHVFDKMEEIKPQIRKDASYTVIDDEDDDEDGESEDDEKAGGSKKAGNEKAAKDDGHTMFFPKDAEVEKRKRNIH